MKHFLILMCGLLLSLPLSAKTVLLKSVNILDTVSGKIQVQQTVLVEGKKIKKIAGELEQKADEIIDLKDAFLLPGLIDAHTHLCWDYDVSKTSYLLSIINMPTAYRALQGARNAKDMLMSGFTFVRALGNAGHYADAALKRAIDEGLLPGPDMMIAGRLISTYGGQMKLNPERRMVFQPEFIYADTRDEIKKAIRENIHFGADVIKIIVSDQRYAYSLEDLKYIVAEAKASDVDVAAHVWINEYKHMKNAILAGVRTIEHGVEELDKETAMLMNKKGVYLIPNSFSKAVINAWGAPTDKIKQEQYERFLKMLKNSYKYKIKVAFGSDLIVTVPGMNRGEALLTYIETFHDAGFSVLEIIQAMTLNAAGALNKQKELGQIKEGYKANIIAVKNNPLNDIDELKDVLFVMKNGDVYKNKIHY